MNKMRSLILAEFVPQEDISAYELALIVANMGFGAAALKHGVQFTVEAFEALDPGVKRHFMEAAHAAA